MQLGMLTICFALALCNRWAWAQRVWHLWSNGPKLPRKWTSTGVFCGWKSGWCECKNDVSMSRLEMLNMVCFIYLFISLSLLWCRAADLAMSCLHTFFCIQQVCEDHSSTIHSALWTYQSNCQCTTKHNCMIIQEDYSHVEWSSQLLYDNNNWQWVCNIYMYKIYNLKHIPYHANNIFQVPYSWVALIVEEGRKMSLYSMSKCIYSLTTGTII